MKAFLTTTRDAIELVLKIVLWGNALKAPTIVAFVSSAGGVQIVQTIAVVTDTQHAWILS